MSEIKTDYSDIHFKDNGKLKLLIIVGTRPEIIRLAAVINKCRKYFDVVLAHTGQNYDYTLNGIFFENLKIENPEVYMDAVGDDLGAISHGYLLRGRICCVRSFPRRGRHGYRPGIRPRNSRGGPKR